jgi:hypothetical protein
MKAKAGLIFVAGIFIVFGFSACYFMIIDGSGDITTEARYVSYFNSLSFSGEGKLIITQGNDESLAVRTDDNLLKYIETEVRGGTLYIDTARGYTINPTGTIEYFIQVRELNFLSVPGAAEIIAHSLFTDSYFNIDISGSADIEIYDLWAQSLYLVVSGVADVALSGTVNTQRMNISGSCTNMSPSLRSQFASVEISGSSEATLWVTDHLDLDISGYGYIRYYGTPILTSDISGVGDVIPLGQRY